MEEVKRRIEKRRKKRTKRRESEVEGTVYLLWKLFEIFSQGRDFESCGGLPGRDLVERPEDLPDCELDTRAHVHVMLDVTDVLVSTSSVVIELCDAFSCYSGWEDVVPQSFSFSKKRAHCCRSTQEEMRYESSQVKARPLSRSRVMPPTPLQNSNDTFEEEQGRFAVENQMWSAKERTTIAKNETVFGRRLQCEGGS